MKPLIYRGEIILSGGKRLFIEPRFNTFATTAAVMGIAMGGATLGLSASGALNPNQPNLGAASRQLSDAQAALLPIQRELEALAATGGSGWIDLPGSSGPMAHNPPPPASLGYNGTPRSRNGTVPNGRVPIHENGPRGRNQEGNSQSNRIFVDFTGMGQADIQKTIADKMAQVGLNLSKKYDPQFIDEALKEQALANPEGTAARKKEYDLIQQQINNHPETPVADLLNSQIGERVNAGKGLDEFDRGVLNDSISKASDARGGNLAPNADFADPLTTGEAGNERQMQGIQQGAGWLSSGETPEDVEYRREQQDLANLSNFAGGRTPESEFSSLSGAQSGPTPMGGGQPLPTTQMNPTIAGAGAAGTTFNQMQTQANPWIAGLSSVINAGNSVANTLYSH